MICDNSGDVSGGTAFGQKVLTRHQIKTLNQGFWFPPTQGIKFKVFSPIKPMSLLKVYMGTKGELV